jgi:apolipoprotein N-acyltransferase
MQGFAHAVILLAGWKRSGIGFLAGIAAAMAMPPLYLFPGLFVGLTLAVWLIDGSEPGRSRLSVRGWWSAFRIGWWFGFGYFLAGLWWLGAAFLVESDEFLWALPLGVIGVPAGLAVFHGLGFMVARLIWSGGMRRIFALAVGLGGADILRGHLLTGFPWNSFGQAFGASLPSLQAASILGLEALTLVAVIAASAFATIGTGRTFLRRWFAPVLSIALLGAIAAHGFLRLDAHGGLSAQLTPETSVPGVSLRIVQPNVSQREKNRPGAAEPILKSYLELSDRATSPEASGLGDVTHLFWPESPFSFILADEPTALRMIGDALPPATTLITGAVRIDRSSAEAGQRVFNALQVVGHDGVIAASYDKVHLVPFGEYLPLADILARFGLRQFITTPGGFQAGGLRPLMRVPGLPPFLPLICYEAIFPSYARGLEERPELIVNITNDAWFGATFGPLQHLEQARMRAVEAGLPLVRSANTGVSAVIDPYGRIVRSLPVGQQGVIDSGLPKVAAEPLASRFGMLFTLCIVAVSFLLAIIRARVA